MLPDWPLILALLAAGTAPVAAVQSPAPSPANAAADEPGPPLLAEYLLAEAKETTGDITEPLVPTDEAASGTEGTSAEPDDIVKIEDRVLRGHTDVWAIWFQGGRTAEVAVVPDGPRDPIDCEVYDEGGNVLIIETENTSTCEVSWSVRWTAEFYIHIRNLTSRAVRYLLIASGTVNR